MTRHDIENDIRKALTRNYSDMNYERARIATIESELAHNEAVLAGLYVMLKAQPTEQIRTAIRFYESKRDANKERLRQQKKRNDAGGVK